MSFGYQNYKDQFEKNVIGNLEKGLKKQGMRKHASYKFGQEDEYIDRERIVKFFKDINERLKNDDSSEELDSIKKEIDKFEKKFFQQEKMRLMMNQSFDFKDSKQPKKNGSKSWFNIDPKEWYTKALPLSVIFDVCYSKVGRYVVGPTIKGVAKAATNSALFIDKYGLDIAGKVEHNKKLNERRKIVEKSIALVSRSCKNARDYIKRIKTTRIFKEKNMRSGKAGVFDITTPKEAWKTGGLPFLLPFMGGKEPLLVRMKSDPTTREKIFEFDRNFATRITGVHLDVVVNQFCNYFDKEIREGYYMEFDFRDKEDLYRICEALVEREVKLDLEKMDLPNNDKYKLVGIYIEQLRNKEREQGDKMVQGFAKDDKGRDFISKSELRKLCARVNVTSGLQKYILEKHKVWITNGTKLTLDQNSSSTAELTMSDFINNPSENPPENHQVVNNNVI